MAINDRARQLRDKHYPVEGPQVSCAACYDDGGNPVAWPCDVSLALDLHTLSEFVYGKAIEGLHNKGGQFCGIGDALEQLHTNLWAAIAVGEGSQLD